MQLTHANGFPIKGNEKSHSSYFSKNPDGRSKKEVSFNERKRRERELSHIKERGTILPSKTDIKFETKDKIECTCKGENENCFKCNGTGLVEKPIKSLQGTKIYQPSNKKRVPLRKERQITPLKKSTEKFFKCEFCKRKPFKTKGALKQHQKTKHSEELGKKVNLLKEIKPSPKIILSSNKSLKCKICDIFFKTEESLNMHMKLKHKKMPTKKKVIIDKKISIHKKDNSTKINEKARNELIKQGIIKPKS